MKIDKERMVPLTLTGVVILLDQGIKTYIVKNWPQIGTLIKDVFNNELLRIYHVRNKAIAFSLGAGVPDALKPVFFVVLPLLVLGLLICYYFKSDEFTPLQRWAAAGIFGGGFGNILDRIFRPDGVVDFISVKFFGFKIESGPLAFLGWERWPTFNIADSSVVVCCIILFLTILMSPKKEETEGTAQ